MRACLCGIRPEHFQLDPDGIDCEVAVVEPTGSESLIVARANGQHLTAAFKDRLEVRPGDRIKLKPDLKKLHFFDSEGRRIA